MLTLGCGNETTSDPPVASATAHVVGLDEAAVSDAFWEENSSFGPTAYRFDSLTDITDAADLVIRGRVVGTQDGELQPLGIAGLREVTFGVVAVDEVLKGTPAMQIPGAVLVARVGSSRQPLREIPSGEVVLFLKHYPAIRSEAGVDQSVDPNDRFYYARPNGYQCVLRNLGGILRIVEGPNGWEDALGPFPAPLDGKVFGDVLEEIRDLARDPA